MVDYFALRDCLEKRRKWYQKAVEMATGQIPFENGFDFPPGVSQFIQDQGNIILWMGAAHELQNTIEMIQSNFANDIKDKAVNGKFKEIPQNDTKSA